MPVPNCAGNWDYVGGGIGDDAGTVRYFVDGGCGGETFGNVDGAGFVGGADHPIAAAGLSSAVVELGAFVVDVLDRG